MNTTSLAIHGLALLETEQHIKQAGALYGARMMRPPSKLGESDVSPIDIGSYFEEGMKNALRNRIAPAAAVMGSVGKAALPSIGSVLGGGAGQAVGSIPGMLSSLGLNTSALSATHAGNQPLSPAAQRLHDYRAGQRR